MLNRNVLVLNQNYEPVSVTIVKRALVLVYLGKAEVVENYSFVIHSVSQTSLGKVESDSYFVPVLQHRQFFQTERPDVHMLRELHL